MYGRDYQQLPEDHWIGESPATTEATIWMLRARLLEVKLMYEAAREERQIADVNLIVLRKAMQGQLDNRSAQTRKALQESLS